MISQPSSTSSVTQTAAKVDARVQPTQPQVMPAVESGPMPIFTMKPASKASRLHTWPIWIRRGVRRQ